MNTLDWSIIGAYIAGLLLLSAVLSRRHRGEADYYVGGRRLPWWAVGLSTMATQSSAISFLGIPAYVALRQGGGLNWLQYELAVPLAMIAVMALLVPFFRRLELISVYEYLELRFGRASRLLLSALFQLSRGLATGVAIYGAGILLSVVLGLPVWATILLIAGVTVIYDTLGGMEAVVYSDVVQMALLVLGLGLCVGLALHRVGGLGEALRLLPAERLTVLGGGSGLGDGAGAPFWGFLFGGLLLYFSYYGVDQSQVQRELSAPNEGETRYSLLLNGLARLPLTMLYLLLGVAVGAVYHENPLLRAAVDRHGSPDYLVPEFLLMHLPQGLRALIVAAILAAAMSSLDSAINSLSAATVRDFIDRGRAEGKIITAKLVTFFWGTLVTLSALWFASQSGVRTLVEQINRVGSAFYGPVVAAFVAGILSKRTTERGVIAGVLAGVAVNAAVIFALPGVFWMWWNPLGFFVALALPLLLRRTSTVKTPPELEAYTLNWKAILGRERPWRRSHALLAAWFLLTLLVAWSLRPLLEAMK